MKILETFSENISFFNIFVNELLNTALRRNYITLVLVQNQKSIYFRTCNRLGLRPVWPRLITSVIFLILVIGWGEAPSGLDLLQA